MRFEHYIPVLTTVISARSSSRGGGG
jgi:hypothetical protein